MNEFAEIAVPPPFPSGEPAFMSDLRAEAPRRAHWSGAASIPAGCLDLRKGWRLVAEFADPEKLLETAYASLERFRNTCELSSDGAVITARCDASLAAEAYRITVSASGIVLESADTEGMRRAVYALIDLLRSQKTVSLPQGCTERKPWLKNRISRCFFGPIKRPPFNRDELTDDIDYYPEPYLDRLASEGVNGLWLTVVWREVASTSLFGADAKREQRLAKLRRTVEKCRRYGIKVWIFCIEPMSWSPRNPLPGGHEALQGDEAMWDTRSFCIASEEARDYIVETSRSIFSEVPHLGGMMLISLGERPTSCLSYTYNRPLGELSCRNRCGLSNPQILDRVLSAIKDGIRAAGSDGEVLSWLYNPYPFQIPNWWFELPTGLDQDKILAFNFESGCAKAQTGRVHSGGDYWLSCAGPSDRFGRMASAARGHCSFAAKLQVGCSHELATVPFMPVPGLLYQKYREMKNLGVEHVIQCWYFGNYPGLMNQAAGKLAFEAFDGDEQTFLEELAGPEWGEDASRVAQAWTTCREGYENYPLDIQFQYYGPMHDGVVWPLHLQQSMTSLTRTWKPEAFPAGDAIGEALGHHSLADVVMLSSLLSGKWHEGASGLLALREKFSDDPARQRDLDLFEALDILFGCGARILRYYSLRRTLFQSPRGFRNVLGDMKKIAEEEMAASRRMIALCEADCRLGYHSEAEVYKFHPAKLRWRIEELEKLTGRIDEVRKMEQSDAEKALAWPGNSVAVGQRYGADTFSWESRYDGDDLVYQVRYQPLSPEFTLEQRQAFFMDDQGMAPPIVIMVAPGGEDAAYLRRGQGIAITDCGNDTFEIRVPLAKFDHAKALFAGFQRTWQRKDGKTVSDNFPAGNYPPDPRLNLNGFTPERMARMVL